MPSGTEINVGLVHEAAWDSTLHQFPDRTVFHSLAWLQILSVVHKVKIVLAKAERGGRTIGLWPFLITRKGPLKVFGSPLPGWSTPYGGPVFADGVSREQVMRAFLNHSAFKGFAYYACKVIDRDASTDLSRLGFTRVLKYDTYRLNLEADETSLWENCRRECRNHIRKAQKNGVEIRAESSDAFIDQYWDMTVETFAKDGAQPTHSKKFIEQLWQLGRPLGIVTFLSAFHACTTGVARLTCSIAIFRHQISCNGRASARPSAADCEPTISSPQQAGRANSNRALDPSASISPPIGSAAHRA
jgi:hypothetical protein